MKIKDKIRGDEFQKYIRLHGAVSIIQKLCDCVINPGSDGNKFTQEQLVALLTIGKNLLSQEDGYLMRWNFLDSDSEVWDRVYRMQVPCSVSDPHTYYLDFAYHNISKSTICGVGDMTLLCDDKPMLSSRECIAMEDDDMFSKIQTSPMGLLMRSTLKVILEQLYDTLANDMETPRDSAIDYWNFVEMVTNVSWHNWDWQWKYTHDSDQYEISHESVIDNKTYRVVFTGRMFAHSLMGNLSLYNGEQQILSVGR